VSKRLTYSVTFVVTILSGIAAAIAIYTAIVEQVVTQAVAITILIIAYAICLVVLASVYSRYRRTFAFSRISEELHSLVHHTRNCLVDLRKCNDKKGELNTIGQGIDDVLNCASRIFRTLTGVKCIASLMLRDDKDNKFRTTAYSTNVSLNRKTNHDTVGLGIDQGTIGIAARTKKVAMWDSSTNDAFTANRSPAYEYYRSGITIPFLIDGKVAGFVNIDTCANNVFSKDHREIAAMIGDAMDIITELGENWRKYP